MNIISNPALPVSCLKFHFIELRMYFHFSRVYFSVIVAVVVAFIICWAPFHAQRLLAIYGLRTGEKPSNAIYTLYTVLTYTSGILYYLSATINPILYNIMSNRFRRAFKVSFIFKLCRVVIW